MMNFSFQSKPSVLRTLQEPPKKKKFNLDRTIFIGILSVLAFLFLRFLFLKMAFIKVDGQISLEKLNVNFTNDVRIQSLIAAEGDSVQRGDTLFSYMSNTFNENSLIERQIKGQSKLTDELEKLKFEMLSVQLEYEKEQKLQELYKNELERVRRLVLLDLKTKNDLLDSEETLSRTELNLWQLEQEIKILRERMALVSNQVQLNNLNTYDFTNGSINSYYVAPISGLIGQVNFSPNEVCYETQSVLTIHNTERVNIKAYFNQDASPDILKGTLVRIKFPDGSSSKGYISNISIATYELPSEFQKKYEPTQRSILATVEPQNIEDLDLWKRFYKMNVKVTINKWI